MFKVYSAGNVIDAQLVCDRLIAEGIEAIVKGGYLSGAAGEIPVDSLVSVWVKKSSDVEPARLQVEEFEQALSASVHPRVCSHCGEGSTSSFSHCWSCSRPL